MAVGALFALERAPSGAGDGPLVVMVHGTMDRSTGFAAVRRALSDLRTIVYDRRGYGRSRHLEPAPDLDAGVDDLLALCAGRPALIVGHSFGGCIALRAAQVAPDVVRAVVVYEPPLPWLVEWPDGTGSGRALAAPDPAAAVDAFLRHAVGDRRWESLPDRVRAERRAEGPALLADLRSVRPGHASPAPLDLLAVAVPVVVGRGTRSPAHLISGCELIAELALAELTVVDGAAHRAQATHPDAVAAMARQGLARIEPR